MAAGDRIQLVTLDELQAQVETLTAQVQTLLIAQGLPAGGTAGQILTKQTEQDYAATWMDPANGGGANVVPGTYTGNGTYGASNPNTLTFASAPKFLFVVPTSIEDSGVIQQFLGIVNGTTMFYTDTTNSSKNFITWSGNTVSWYCVASSVRQLNKSDHVYRYVAIL